MWELFRMNFESKLLKRLNDRMKPIQTVFPLIIIIDVTIATSNANISSI